VETRSTARARLSQRSLRATLVAALILLALLAGGGARSAHPALVPGGEVDGVFAEQASDAYPIDLSAGDFLRLILRQHGADVALELDAPDGTVVVSVDGPNPDAEYAVEDLAVVAPVSGRYQVRVVAGVKKEPPFGYRLRMNEPRPATADDRRRETAMRADQEATGLIAGGFLERQLELRETARRIWHDLGERRCEAATLLQLGTLLERMRRPAAVENLLEAARLWEALGDRGWQARALTQAGEAAAELARLDEAQAPLEHAIALATGPEDEATRAHALNILGRLRLERGEARAAEPLLEEALRIDVRRGDDESRASVLVNLGYTLMDLSETQQALERFQEAAKVQGATDQDRAAAQHALGNLYETLGNWDKATDGYRRALAIVEPLGDQRRTAATLNNLGVVYHLSGQIQEALKAYRRALDLARASGAVEVQAQLLTNLGSIEREMGRTDEAIASWRDVAKLAGDRRDLEIPALTARASLQKATGDLPAAQKTMETAVARAKARENLPWEAEATRSIAQIEKERGFLENALDHIESAIAIVESQRSQVASEDLRALFLARKQSYYELALDVLMALHAKHPGEDWNARAVQMSERARARSLLDLLTVGGGARTGVAPEVVERERQALSELHDSDNQYQHLVLAGAPAERIASADARLTKAVERFDSVESEIRAGNSAYAALTQPQPLAAREIQAQVLDGKAVLLEFALGKERSYAWVVTPTAVASAELPPRAEIEETARRFYTAVATGPSVPGETPDARRDRLARGQAEAAAAGRELSRMILAPLDRFLGDGTVLVVADGMLQYVPFAALPLPAGAGSLLSRNEIVSLPSASALAVLRKETAGRPAAPKALAVFADPVFEREDIRFARVRNRRDAPQQVAARRGPAASRQGDASYHRLPFSAEEAKAILGLVPAGQAFSALGFDASVRNALSGHLSDYRVVHFATHGIIDTAQPELSRLMLSRWNARGEPLDGSLRLADIYAMDLHADLVVLSACETALGKEVRGEGLIGLTRGFMYAGARRVLASLWRIDDRATSHLMRDFYRHLLDERLPPAAALRRAQLDLAADPRWQSPYYWAGFSLQGEWQ
jgi:CHAT domain-containing protein/Tfp pilus assembly protein PilF